MVHLLLGGLVVSQLMDSSIKLQRGTRWTFPYSVLWFCLVCPLHSLLSTEMINKDNDKMLLKPTTTYHLPAIWMITNWLWINIWLKGKYKQFNITISNQCKGLWEFQEMDVVSFEYLNASKFFQVLSLRLSIYFVIANPEWVFSISDKKWSSYLPGQSVRQSADRERDSAGHRQLHLWDRGRPRAPRHHQPSPPGPWWVTIKSPPYHHHVTITLPSRHHFY